MKKQCNLILTLFIVIFILVGFGLTQVNRQSKVEEKQVNSDLACQAPKTSDQTKDLNLQISSDGKTVSYSGQTGKTALEILGLLTDIKSEESSFGPMVKSINCLDQTDKEFWTYTVDGQMASVGANEYQTKDGQKIEWQLKGM